MADLGTAYVQIVASADGIAGSISSVLEPEANSAAGNAGKTITTKMDAIGKSITKVGKGMTVGVTMPLVGVGVAGAKSFADVDKTMQLVKATMGDTKFATADLSSAMKDAAANSVFGMSDAATASLNFARAGLDASEAANALAPSMNLAAAAGGDLDVVSNGLVATINGFAGSFSDTGHYADVFANACNNSALDVNSLSSAMSVAAPIFNAAGYAVDDAALYMGVMANAGIEASVGANSLKTGLSRLVSPAKEGSEWMEKLGISVTNSDGTMKDSVTVQQELHDAFAGLSESEQIAAASAIFGKNQMSNWLALINTAPEDVQALSDSIEVEGTTAEQAEAMMSGFGGSMEKLKSSVDVAKTSLGEALAPTIEKVAEVIQKVVDWFNALDPAQQQLIAKIAMVVAAIGPALLVAGKLITTITSIINTVKMLGSVFSFISMGPLAIVIAAIAAAVVIGIYLYKHWDEIQPKLAAIWEKIKAVAMVVWEVIKGVIITPMQIAWTIIKNVWNGVKNFLTSAWNTIKSVAQAAWNTIKTVIINPIQNAWQTITRVVGNIKNTMTSVFNAIKSTVTTIWNGIKTAITQPIETAKNTVKTIIDKIKGFFPMSIGKIFSNLKLPHFSISGSFSLNPPSIPKIGVSWYKTGGIFDGASIIGVGEDTAEAVVPLSGQRMRPFAQAIASEMRNSADGESVAEVLYLLRRYLPECANTNVYIDSDTLVGKTVAKYDSALGMIASRRERGLA